jgi:hypothetical protein
MNRWPLTLVVLVLCLPTMAAETPRQSTVGLMIHWDRDVIAAADPGEFDADAWARAAKDAGFTTLVVAARHADGFHLPDARPAALREAAQACRKHGLSLGLAYAIANVDPLRVAKPQLRKLITACDPAAIWFEGGAPKDVHEYCRALKPTLVTYDRPDVLTMNDSRGYRKDDNRWKPAGRIVEALVDRVGRDGGALLCVGPMPSGELPPQALQRLGEIGKWMAVNRAAVEGVGPGPFKKLRHAKATTGPGKVYLHVTFWPIDGKLVVPLKNKVHKAYALAKPAETYPIAFEEVPTLTLPTDAVGPRAMPEVIVLEIDGEPQAVEYVARPVGAGRRDHGDERQAGEEGR